MTPPGRTTEIAFVDRLSKINEALSKGNLIREDLQVVEKYGIKWVWIKFTHSILTILSYFTGQDPWQAYRINTIAESLFIFAAHNDITPIAKKHFKEIMAKLEEKAGRSCSTHKEAYLEALQLYKNDIEEMSITPIQIVPSPP